MRPYVWLYAFLLLTGGARAATPAYTLLDLGPVSFHTDVDLNDRGQVAFVSPNGNLVRYTNGLGLETLSDRRFQSIGIGINNRGQVAGQVRIPDEPYYVAFRYTDGAGVEILQPSEKSYGAGINDLGHVAVPSGSNLYLYTDAGGLTLLGPDIGLVHDINNADEIVGTRSTGPFVYRPGTGFETLSQAGPGVRPYAISDTGYIVGGVFAQGGRRAFRLNPGGDVTLLSAHLTAEAYGVNDLGHTVGLVADPFANETAFLFTDAGGVRDLNTLIDPSARWRLERPLAINNWGQIAGLGVFNGTTRAFRLDPVNPIPEPGTLALLAVGLLPLARRGRGMRTNPRLA